MQDAVEWLDDECGDWQVANFLSLEVTDDLSELGVR